MKFYALMFALSVYTSSLWACSCDTIAFEDAIVADEIFLGTLFEAEFVVTEYDEFDSVTYERGYWKYYFKVRKKWKGTSSKIAVVKQTMTTCAYPFELNHSDYLVYSYHGENSLISMATNILFSKESETYLCACNTGQYYTNSYDGFNWFDSDIALLNKRFPEPIKLSSYPKLWNWIGTLMILVSSGFIMYRLRKR